MSEVPEVCRRCGACRGVCLVEDLSPEVESSVLEREDKFLCANCWKCMEVCPHQVDIYGIMMEARRKRNLPESFHISVKNIISTGYSMPMRGMASIREMYGLRPIEPPDMEKMRRLLRETVERVEDGRA